MQHSMLKPFRATEPSSPARAVRCGMRVEPLLLLLFLLALVQIPVGGAQSPAPWELAEALNGALFEAQKQLLLEQPVEATTALDEAQAQLLRLVDEHGLPVGSQQTVEEALAMARAAVARGDANVLAVARGQARTGVLLGSYTQTLAAIDAGEVARAQQWLLVRDFRPSTRFERPGADATLALNQLAAGNLSAAEARQSVTADLFDTYQAQLQRLLRETVDDNLFLTRRSESAGLAQGYWRIIAGSFEEQVGSEARATVDAAFDRLIAAVIAGEDEVQASVATIEAQVQNFRASPLAEEELIRRTGQLIRYLSLVPVEYERGVKNGEVFLAFEIQEAVTFMSGAQAAFADLRSALSADQPELVESVQRQMDVVEADLAAANRNEAVIPVREMNEKMRALNGELEALLPEAWNQLDPDADFDVISAVLDQVEEGVAQGQYDMAKSAHLEAYAVFDFGPEPRLLAFAPDQVARIDGLFWQGYNGEPGLAEAIAMQASPETIGAIRATLDEALADAQQTLGDLPTAPGAIITNAAIIVFREGLEAVVILAALTASFVGTLAHFRRYVALGALAAFIATVITGVVMRQLLSSFARVGERLEVVVSLVAIAVILLITNWFFHKAYWTDHMKGMHQQKAQIIRGGAGGQTVGLIVLGFTSIYREGFETVLFLQALLLDAGSSIVLRGVLLGLIGVGAAGVATFALQRRLPYMKLFVTTAILIGVVLVTMVGNTVHVMQKVGWLPIHPIQGLDIPYWMGLWFGLFPTWEGIGLQVGAAAFVIGSYYLAEWMRRRERASARRKPATGQAAG